MEREKFEDSWKKAFERAEVSPSENVWTNIELDLEKARGGELKKRLMFYKMLAAACVVFAMAVGGVGYYVAITPSTSSNLAGNSKNLSAPESATDNNTQPTSDSGPDKPTTLDVPLNAAQDPIADAEVNAQHIDRSSSSTHAGDSHQAQGQGNKTAIEIIENGQASATRASSVEEDKHITDLVIRERALTPLYTPREIRLNIPGVESTIDPVVAMLAKLEQREKEVQGEKEHKKKSTSGDENLWTSIGFAAGSFNTMQASSSSPVAGNRGAAFANAMAAPIVDQESNASGYSYTMGVNLGTKLSERWVLQGGVNYLTHSSEYTANNVVMESVGKFNQQQFRAASTNDLVNADEKELSNKLVYSAPYSVNNSMRYLSIPMQAGYLLINKTFGLQLNAGVATDLFLQNTVKAESQQLATTSQPSGSDSPFRTVNLSGLFGTEVSYRFGPHYRVSLNPGIRYPFNTIYKTEVGVQSTPLTFDVGLRFRYIFH